MQNSIKTRGNLCTELGSPVLVLYYMFYIGVWKFSFYPERRTETTKATEVGEL